MIRIARSLPLPVASMCLALGSADAGAQAIVRGRVVEELSERPVAAAEVLLADEAGVVMATTVTDPKGFFALAAPRAGVAFLQVLAEGFEPLLSSPLSLGSEGVLDADVQLIPRVVEIAGLTVTVDALEETRARLANWGVTLEDLGDRFIPQEAIERRLADRDVGDMIAARSLPGVSASRAENAGRGSEGFLCISFSRARTAQGMTRCALLVVDGLPVPTGLALDIPSSNLRAIVLLRPTEATLVYGTPGGAGAVLLFTKSGRR